jgi:hypothetical protein
MPTLAWSLSQSQHHPCTTTLAQLFASSLDQPLLICRPSASLAVAQLLSQHCTWTSGWPASRGPPLDMSTITTYYTNHHLLTSLEQLRCGAHDHTACVHWLPLQVCSGPHCQAHPPPMHAPSSLLHVGHVGSPGVQPSVMQPAHTCWVLGVPASLQPPPAPR